MKGQKRNLLRVIDQSSVPRFEMQTALLFFCGSQLISLMARDAVSSYVNGKLFQLYFRTGANGIFSLSPPMNYSLDQRDQKELTRIDESIGQQLREIITFFLGVSGCLQIRFRIGEIDTLVGNIQISTPEHIQEREEKQTCRSRKNKISESIITILQVSFDRASSNIDGTPD